MDVSAVELHCQGIVNHPRGYREEFMRTDNDAIFFTSQSERDYQKEFLDHLKKSPIPEDETMANLGLFLTSKTLARLLFYYELYKRIVNIHGVIIEFGVRWGQTVSLLAALRGIFEPFNRHRKIIGFDTFAGFTGLAPEDGNVSQCAEGSYSVPSGYEDYLDGILKCQEQLNPIGHLKKYELIKGDALQTVPEYLERHPETIVSLAIFDFDLYAPTKAALEAIRPRLCRGSIIVFDELCDEIFPGETLAVMESLGLNNYRLERMPFASRLSFIEF